MSVNLSYLGHLLLLDLRLPLPYSIPFQPFLCFLAALVWSSLYQMFISSPYIFISFHDANNTHYCTTWICFSQHSLPSLIPFSPWPPSLPDPLLSMPLFLTHLSSVSPSPLPPHPTSPHPAFAYHIMWGSLSLQAYHYLESNPSINSWPYKVESVSL